MKALLNVRNTHIILITQRSRVQIPPPQPTITPIPSASSIKLFWAAHKIVFPLFNDSLTSFEQGVQNRLKSCHAGLGFHVKGPLSSECLETPTPRIPLKSVKLPSITG